MTTTNFNYEPQIAMTRPPSSDFFNQSGGVACHVRTAGIKNELSTQQRIVRGLASKHFTANFDSQPSDGFVITGPAHQSRN